MIKAAAMKMFLPLSIALVALLLLATCEREWSNPFDPNNTLDPEAWAPQNLQIEDVSFTEKLITWTYQERNIEGFRLERKRGDEPWQVNFQTFPKTDRAYLDTISLNPAIYYHYRLYAYAGQNTSATKDTSFLATIPAPIDFTITVNSISSVTLRWGYHLDGYEGFKIERKRSDGNWIVLSTTPNTTITDNSFELNTQVNYRVSAYFGQHSSDYSLSNFDSTIPPPENLTIIANSSSSVTLNWNYNSTGHEGFKIERKIDNGSWEPLENNLSPGQTNFTDNDIELNNHNYHYRIYTFFGQYSSQEVDFPVIPFLCGILSIIDSRDGNQYQTVQIGNQCWLKENLKWLPSVSPPAYGSKTSPFYYVYNYRGISVVEAKVTTNYQTYGVLYNWPAALIACPDGWHLPSNNEWTVLIDYLGGSDVAGGKMKTTGTTHWNSPNTGATNESGFSGLPGGVRDYYYNEFFDCTYSGRWWSSVEYSSIYAWYLILGYDAAVLNMTYYHKEEGGSVRCLMD